MAIRWNSGLNMATSIIAAYDQLQDILKIRNEFDWLQNLFHNRHHLEQMTVLFSPMLDWTKKLSYSKSATLHLAAFAHYSLKQHFNALPVDAEWFDVAANLYQEFAGWKLNDCVLGAVALNPFWRKMKFLDEIQKVRAKIFLKDAVKDVIERSLKNAESLPPPPKRRRRDEFEDDENAFDDSLTNDEPNPSSAKNIVEKYLDGKITLPVIPDHVKRHSSEESDIILGYWCKIAACKEHEFYYLGVVALKLLTIPASSTVVEQLFSQLKFVFTQHRVTCVSIYN